MKYLEYKEELNHSLQAAAEVSIFLNFAEQEIPELITANPLINDSFKMKLIAATRQFQEDNFGSLKKYEQIKEKDYFKEFVRFLETFMSECEVKSDQPISVPSATKKLVSINSESDDEFEEASDTRRSRNGMEKIYQSIS